MLTCQTAWIDYVTAFGVLVALFQLLHGNRTKRGEYVHSLYEKIISDEHIKNAVYTMDYGGFWYNDSFHGSVFEKEVDSLFRYLSFICYLYDRRLISEKEMTLFEYVLNRTCLSAQSIEYLWNIYHFARSNGLECSFSPLIKYGESRGRITTDFYNRESRLFHKYLNF